MADLDDALRARLQQIGLKRGLAGLADSPDQGAGRKPHKVRRSQLPGMEHRVGDRVFWLDIRHYSSDYCHGRYAVATLDSISPDALDVLGVPDLGSRPAFIDTETTGLAGGAGTLAFEVGVGIRSEAGFELHLLLMRDPEEEPAALDYLTKLLSRASGLVTFNGRTFDLPILETRYVLNRLPPAALDLPHLDLLNTARQLWRDHLPSRRLGVLEESILGVTRSEQDLNSGLIPWMYRQYLETGDPADMVRVLYHNEVDVLSLASLLVHVARMVTEPESMDLAAAEWVGVGRVYDRAGLEHKAIRAWEAALSGDLDELDGTCAARVWSELGVRHRRRGAWSSALSVWDSWQARLPGAVEPLVEAAKYYEWQAKDLEQAMACTQAALSRALEHPSGLGRLSTLAELEHRRDRIEAKLRGTKDA